MLQFGFNKLNAAVSKIAFANKLLPPLVVKFPLSATVFQLLAFAGK